MDNYLDHYCERLAPGLWGEPFNSISNLAFFVTAYLIYRQFYAKRHLLFSTGWDLWLLLMLVVAIGTGSTAWHLLANHWSLWSDRIPILLFINVYLLSCLYRVIRLPLSGLLVAFLLYHAINTNLQLNYPAETLNGSLFYIPTLIFLIGITMIVWSRGLPGTNYFVLAANIFTISLAFRTIDLWFCDSFSIGTHFIWHILNAITIYLLMAGLFKNQTPIGED